jgi:hypothetical protein
VQYGVPVWQTDGLFGVCGLESLLYSFAFGLWPVFCEHQSAGKAANCGCVGYPGGESHIVGQPVPGWGNRLSEVGLNLGLCQTGRG